jgi:hypothetical protein
MPTCHLADLCLHCLGCGGDLEGERRAEFATFHFALEDEGETLEKLQAPVDPVQRAAEHPGEILESGSASGGLRPSRPSRGEGRAVRIHGRVAPL